MTYRHVFTPPELPTGNELTRAMAGIGMCFAATPLAEPNIEDTLLGASIEGMERDDLRVLAVLVTWLGVHHPWVNANKLIRAVRQQESPRVRAFWAAVAQWMRKDWRFAPLTVMHEGARIDVLRVGTEFQVRRRGEDTRFQGTALRVPAGVLRDRAEDVLPPAELAKRHRTYRDRMQQGPSYLGA